MSADSKKHKREAAQTSTKFGVKILKDNPDINRYKERRIINELFGEIGINNPVGGCKIC